MDVDTGLNKGSISAPPDYAYRSYEDAYNALKHHGLENGYAFRLKGSRPYNSSTKTRFYFVIIKLVTTEAKLQFGRLDQELQAVHLA
jgi:hypothetical protein